MLIGLAVATDWRQEVISEEKEVKPAPGRHVGSAVGSAVFSVCLDASFLASPSHRLVNMGRSGKLPSGVSAKLKRWKKGHSSDSNPATCRHRQAARSRFFSRPSGSPAVGFLGRRLWYSACHIRMPALGLTVKTRPSSLTVAEAVL